MLVRVYASGAYTDAAPIRARKAVAAAHFRHAPRFLDFESTFNDCGFGQDSAPLSRSWMAVASSGLIPFVARNDLLGIQTYSEDRAHCQGSVRLVHSWRKSRTENAGAAPTERGRILRKRGEQPWDPSYSSAAARLYYRARSPQWLISGLAIGRRTRILIAVPRSVQATRHTESLPESLCRPAAVGDSTPSGKGRHDVANC